MKRFWDKVKKMPSGCWEWVGYREGNRGRFRLKGRLLSAHRVAWELTHGSISQEARILSRCGNSGCVNPDHLYKDVFWRYKTRFWSKVRKTDGCWIWLGTVTHRGYGEITVSGRAEAAHRFSWTIRHGPIPNGLWVLHHCDNPLCVRPDHLFLGTRSDNMIDCAKKGRVSGIKLTFEKAQEIRNKYAGGDISQTQLSKEYGVVPTQISHIVRNKRWKEEKHKKTQ